MNSKIRNYFNSLSQRLVALLLICALLVTCSGCGVNLSYSNVESVAEKIIEQGASNSSDSDNNSSNSNSGSSNSNSAGSGTVTAASTDNAEFAAFTDEIFKELITGDYVSYHYYINNGANFGIDESEVKVSLGEVYYDPEGDLADTKETLAKLNSFDKSSLSYDQQTTYDELKYELELSIQYADYELYTSDFAPYTGIQTEMPILLAEYEFYNENDIKNYLTLIADLPRYYADLIEYEKKRSEAGYFMSDENADIIIEECQSYINNANSDSSTLVVTFDERIDNCSFLSDDAKKSYKESNKAACAENVTKANQIVVDGLTALKGSGKNSKGLYYYSKGTGCFEGILKADTGWSKSVSEFDTLIDSYISSYTLTLQKAYMSDRNVYTEAESYSCGTSDPNKILEDLKSKYSKYFPAITNTSYEVKYVSDSLSDYASPAMYFKPQLDNLNKNVIYINSSGVSTETFYTTLAHEGFPGHLYQTQYFASTNPCKLRYVLSPSSYEEGWASYVEMLAYDWDSNNSSTLNTFMKANRILLMCMYAKLDIGVNYYGWDESEMASQIKKIGFSVTDTDALHEMYLVFVSNPGYYCKYSLGMLGFMELESTAKSELGTSYNSYDFYKFLMDEGSMQFDLLFSKLESWISSQKNNNAI